MTGKKKENGTYKMLGMYVHIPFCASKCQYCDFCSVAGGDGLMQSYQQALVRHIKESCAQAECYKIDTLYFGGGTPSYYGAKRLIKLFDVLKKSYNVLIESEVTLEANPDSIKKADMKKLRREGFNRISIGVQSASDYELKMLGRRHTFARAEVAVKAAQDAGFDNVSIDLMYGLPGQTRAGWADTLARSIALKPQHVSCYGLKLEEGTPLYERREISNIPDDDEQALMYLYAVEALERMGYRQYEISNFARPGFESKHNPKYWRLGEYMGFGASAFSDLGGRRYGYVRDVRRYMDGVTRGEDILIESEILNAYERASEYVMLGLRTTYGISEEEYRSIYQVNFEPIRRLFESYQSRGLTRGIDGRWSLTPSGFLISNVLIGEVIELIAEQKSTVGSPWLGKKRNFDD